uniref:Uncharacterized protein n=1 Tax=Globisporangium ultimum (strain ATCC 200006 / CBS 805.95 / DAOM BR144) TaxID=431595 RepID=K3XC41_GLOUD
MNTLGDNGIAGGHNHHLPPRRAVAADNGDDDELQVDTELVRKLLDSGSADAIVAEQAAKALARKTKHRESMIRYRRRKKSTFGEMQSEEQQLALKLHQLLYVHKAQAQCNDQDATFLRSPSRVHAQTSPFALMEHAPTPVDKFVHVLAQKEHLHHENVALRKQLEDYQRLRALVQDHHDNENAKREQMLVLSMKEHKRNQNSGNDSGESSPGSSSSGGDQRHRGSDRGVWVTFLENDVPFYYEPFSEQEAITILTNTLQSVFALQTAYDAGMYNESTRLVSLFDWKASLAFEVDDAIGVTMIRYQFKKTFRNATHNIDTLAQRLWEIMHDARQYQMLHRVPVFSKILQRISSVHSVAIWNAPEPEQSTRYRNVSLFSRCSYQNPRGNTCELVSITGIPLKHFSDQQLQTYDQVRPHHAGNNSADEAADDPEVVYTHGGFLYTTFANGANEGEVEVEFGGRTDILNEAQGRFLMVELGGTCVRLEHLLFPCRVLR